MKGALVVVQSKGRSCTSMCSRQACHSLCSPIHPIGDHNHRSYFFKIRYLLLEWSGQLIF
ncbi:MAG: hypothetical protein P8179_00755 [Candidatus Thiodiazotropha sp.]